MDQDDYTAIMDQRLARMRETARLAAAFFKGLVEEGVPPSEAQGITAIYALALNAQDPEEE